MGECGCSMQGGDFRLAAPDGGWYVVSRYPGCDECDAPAGVDIWHVRADEVRDFDTLSVPEAVISRDAPTMGVAVFDQRVLGTELLTVCKGLVNEDGTPFDDIAAECIAEEVFPATVRSTFKKYDKALRSWLVKPARKRKGRR